MDFGLKNKIAVVCGSSQGLGFASSRELAKKGCSVVICSRDKSRIEQAARKIGQETGGSIFPYQVDLSNTNQVVNFTKTVISEFNRIDILVNNTGGPPAGFFMDLSEQDWSAAFQNTFLSAVTLTKHILPVMIEENWGRIINLQSISMIEPISDLILSNSVRMAVAGWAKTLSNQYAKYNITINNIATGFTLTERLISLVENKAKQEKISAKEVVKKWEDQIPAGRLAKPEEIAWLVTFLASEQAGYITGATIPVDGGYIQSSL